MTDIKIETKAHPEDTELSDFLSQTLARQENERIEEHIAGCGECLTKIVSAYEAVGLSGGKRAKKRKAGLMKKMNWYLALAAISFSLSFIMPKYFIQLLVATMLFGIKWIVDSKSTKMLVMIYEAWKKGGEKEAGRIIKTLK